MIPSSYSSLSPTQISTLSPSVDTTATSNQTDFEKVHALFDAKKHLLEAAKNISESFNNKISVLTDEVVFKNDSKSFKELTNIIKIFRKNTKNNNDLHTLSQCNIENESISTEKKKELQDAWRMFTKAFEKIPSTFTLSTNEKCLPLFPEAQLLAAASTEPEMRQRFVTQSYDEELANSSSFEEEIALAISLSLQDIEKSPIQNASIVNTSPSSAAWKNLDLTDRPIRLTTHSKEEIHECLKPIEAPSLSSRFRMAIDSISSKAMNAYLPIYLKNLSDHEDYKNIYRNDRPSPELEALSIALLHAWAKTDLDPDSICIPDNVNFCFMDYDRAKVFMHQAVSTPLSCSDCQRMLNKIILIPNLNSTASRNIDEMMKILLILQSNKTLKPNDEFSVLASKIVFTCDPFKNLIQLVNEFPGEGNIHYRWIATFITSSNINHFRENDVEHIRGLVEIFTENKMFNYTSTEDKRYYYTDWICIQLLQKCNEILQCKKLKSHSETTHYYEATHDTQAALIASLINQHRQNALI
jgi:hypothetical protein